MANFLGLPLGFFLQVCGDNIISSFVWIINILIYSFIIPWGFKVHGWGLLAKFSENMANRNYIDITVSQCTFYVNW